MTNASNLATQARLRQMMDEAKQGGWHFSSAGYHYLACRVNGVKYRKAILAGFELLLAGTLQKVIPIKMIEEAKNVLNRKELPDEALIIFATGRKPVLNAAKTHWQEEQSSLLNPLDLTENMLATLPKAKQDRLRNAQQLQQAQGEVCVKLMDFLTAQYDLKYPPTPAPEKPVVKATKAKSNVVQINLAKKKKVAVAEPLDLIPEPQPDPDPEVVMEMYGINPDVFEEVDEDAPVTKNAPVVTPTSPKVKRTKTRKVTVK